VVAVIALGDAAGEGCKAVRLGDIVIVVNGSGHCSSIQNRIALVLGDGTLVLDNGERFDAGGIAIQPRGYSGAAVWIEPWLRHAERHERGECPWCARLDRDGKPAVKKKIWSCKIGEAEESDLLPGDDLPMREAVRRAYRNLTGREPCFIFSGWGAELDECERAVVEDREPRTAGDAKP